MRKRSVFSIQIEILKAVNEDPDITMSSLERKVGTNPHYLREYCKYLEFFNLIKIKKEQNTQKVSLTKNGLEVVEKEI